MLVAIEGIDGSGKGTQAQRLCERSVSVGLKAALISFPRYETTTFGRAIGEFLNGAFGSLDEVSPYLAALLYAGDRFESRDEFMSVQAASDMVIFDRYVASNIAHQGAKQHGRDRRRLIEWIRTIEYDIYRLPPADLTILLDLPVTAAVDLIARKSARSYTDKAADLQEADAVYLESVRELYLELAASEENWLRVDVVRDGALRTIDEIGDEIWTAIEERRS